MSYPSAGEPLPAPLPPETRTVGQLIAETIRLFGDRFVPALPLGLPVAVLDVLAFGRTVGVQTVLLWAFAPAFAAAFVWASSLVCGVALTRRSATIAFAVGVLVFLPFPVLYRLFVIPGLALFALVGLAVPAAVVEGRGFGGALRRGFALGRADVVHALGGLATLALVYGLSRYALLFLLRTQSDQTQQVAGFLADLVLAPMLFLGPALLYGDQAARVAKER
jgi:hypothetical protein